MQKRKFLLEIAADSPESVEAAIAGGADRIELCANLVIGGTTPGISFFRMVRDWGIPCYPIIRPRFGDFCYTDAEFRLMLEDIRAFRAEGAKGVVVGILKPDGALDEPRMEQAIRAADGMAVTLHRAFDMTRDPMEALRQAGELGVTTVLTSGQQGSAPEGAALIRQLVAESRGAVQIMAGGGVRPHNMKLLAEAGVVNFHMAAKVVRQSAMEFRRREVSMGLPAMSEYEIWRTDEAVVREGRRILDALELCV